MHLAGCIPIKMFLVSYEEILNDVKKIFLEIMHQCNVGFLHDCNKRVVIFCGRHVDVSIQLMAILSAITMCYDLRMKLPVDKKKIKTSLVYVHLSTISK